MTRLRHDSIEMGHWTEVSDRIAYLTIVRADRNVNAAKLLIRERDSRYRRETGK